MTPRRACSFCGDGSAEYVFLGVALLGLRVRTYVVQLVSYHQMSPIGLYHFAYPTAMREAFPTLEIVANFIGEDCHFKVVFTGLALLLWKVKS